MKNLKKSLRYSLYLVLTCVLCVGCNGESETNKYNIQQNNNDDWINNRMKEYDRTLQTLIIDSMKVRLISSDGFDKEYTKPLTQQEIDEVIYNLNQIFDKNLVLIDISGGVNASPLD